MSNLQGNRQANQFEDLVRSLKPHPSKSQILIEARSKGATLEKALTVLKTSGISQIQHQILRRGDPIWILFQFPNKSFRQAILNLTESGFIKLKGISPQPESRKHD